MYKRETELRHLQPNDAYKLGVILDDNNCWKKLMEVIPKEINSQASSADGALSWEHVTAAGLKYNNDHIRLIENAINRPGESRLFSQILFEEWGSSGRKHERPTVGILLQLLVKADLFRAADYVAVNFLNESPPERPLSGPAAKIDISLSSEIFNDIEEFANDSSYYPGTETLIDNANYANSAVDHNKDFYTKYQRVDKLMGIAEEDIITPPKPPPRTLRNTRLQSQIQQQQQMGMGNEVSTAEAINRSTTNAQLQAQPTQVQSMQQAEQQLYDGTHESNNLLTSQNIPKFSALITNTSFSITNQAQSEDDENTALSQNTEITNLSEAPIPLVSMLAGTSTNAAVTTNHDTNEIIQVEIQQSSDIITTDSDILPVISALNLNGERGASEKSERKLLNNINIVTASKHPPSTASSSLLQASTALSNHSERSHSRSSSLSNDSIDEDIELPADIAANINHQYNNVDNHAGVSNIANCVDTNSTCNVDNHESFGADVDDDDDDDDDDDNSIPNLSVFEQRSSNNDSSLTTVTGTSGENSFELSMNDCSSASNENIPCLSALKQ